MLKQIICVAALVALAGCGDKPVQTSKEKREAQKEARFKKAELLLNSISTPKTYRIDGNEIKVVEVPTVDSGGYVVMQRCFVWRDTEFKTSALSCPNDPDVPLPLPGGPTFDQH